MMVETYIEECRRLNCLDGTRFETMLHHHNYRDAHNRLDNSQEHAWFQQWAHTGMDGYANAAVLPFNHMFVRCTEEV